MDTSRENPWISNAGPDSDVIVSCRVRLARNIAGFPFVRKATQIEQAELINLLRDVLMGAHIADRMVWIDLAEVSHRERMMLFERHLISKQHAESDARRGVAISGDESLSIMVNEEDHLRVQLLAPGLQMDEIFKRINQIDDRLESKVDFAFDKRWGYLTACPTNIGTGIRFSAMLHLPALKITNEIERVRRAAKDMHLAVRGYYGEGSESAGDFYQISNQVTLGRAEHELLEEFSAAILPRIVEYEQQARELLMRRNETLLDDRVHRAFGVLTSARLLGAEEAMKLLSRVRLGVSVGKIKDVEPALVNRLFLEIQPAHLKTRLERDLTSDELRVARAALVREMLMNE